MTADDIRPFLTADPFEPFTLHMTSRSTYDVDRPELVSFSPDGGVMYVRTPAGLRAMLALGHVVSISFPPPPVIRGAGP